MGMFNSAREMVDRHYKAMANADCNTCNVGTWAIKRSAFLCRGNKKIGLWDTLKSLNLFGQSAPHSDPASTIAEGARRNASHCGDRKLLALCKGPSFSDGFVMDAMRMAAQAGMAIVALNIYEHGNEFSEFQRQAKSRIDGFQRKAQAAGLSFTHMVAKGPEALTLTRLLASGFRFRQMMVDTPRTVTASPAVPGYARATLRAK